MKYLGKITDDKDLVTKEYVDDGLGLKQNTLTQGSNITISGSTISATDTTYENKTASSGGTDVSLVTTGEKYTWNAKQDSISDLATIRSGAALGATALQSYTETDPVFSASVAANITSSNISTWNAKQNAITSSNKLSASLVNGLATVATTGSYEDLTSKPTIPEAITESTVSGWGFTKNTGTVSSLSDLSITASASEINKLNGVTATTEEINYIDGVTSNVQTQLDAKQATINASNKLSVDYISGLETYTAAEVDTLFDSIS